MPRARRISDNDWCGPVSHCGDSTSDVNEKNDTVKPVAHGMTTVGISTGESRCTQTYSVGPVVKFTKLWLYTVIEWLYYHSM